MRGAFAGVLLTRRGRLALLASALVAAAAMAILFTGSGRTAGGGVGDDPVPALVQVTVHASDQGDIGPFFSRKYEFTGLSEKARAGKDAGDKGHDYSPFMITKPLDAADSPQLARAFTNDEPLTSVEVRVLSNTGTPILSYTLSDAWIAVYRHQTPTSLPGALNEDVGFGFKTIVYNIGGSPITDRAKRIFDTRERNARH